MSPIESHEPRQGSPEHERPENGEQARDVREAAGSEREAVPEMRDDVERERHEATKEIAGAVWAKPARFVEHVVAHKLVPQVRRFLERFAALDDDALTTQDLRNIRTKAKDALDETDRR